jgi:hypothetical protein
MLVCDSDLGLDLGLEYVSIGFAALIVDLKLVIRLSNKSQRVGVFITGQ